MLSTQSAACEGWIFRALITRADWMRLLISLVLPGFFSQMHCAVVLRSSLYAKPPIFLAVSSSPENQSAFKHSARTLPLKASTYVLSAGLPGRKKSNITLL